jgi:hypothetical protein
MPWRNREFFVGWLKGKLELALLQRVHRRAFMVWFESKVKAFSDFQPSKRVVENLFPEIQ